jgi:rubrerythrin
MSDGDTDLADGLKKAIMAERDGHSFYRMAASCSEDPKAKDVFARLASEELDHMGFLMKQYESVLNTGRPLRSAKLGSRADLSGSSPIFSDRIRARIQDAHVEMSALSIGIQLELDSMAFYRSQADTVSDPTVSEFYTELAEWEAEHYAALLRQQQELKENYWSASGFYPF